MAYIISISITDEEVQKYLLSRDDRSAFIVQLVRDFMGDTKKVAPQEEDARMEISERGKIHEYNMYEEIARKNGNHFTARDYLMHLENKTLRELLQRISKKRIEGEE